MIKRRVLVAATGAVLLIGMIVWMGAPERSRITRVPRIHCANNLKLIGVALQLYASDYEGMFPPDLFPLVEEGYLCSPTRYCCPAHDMYPPKNPPKSRADFVCDYWYRPGFSESNASINTGIVMDKSGNHTNFGNILFSDGHVEGFSGEKWYLNASGMDGPPPENRRNPGKRPRLGCGR